MVNVNKLKGKIVECSINIETLAESMGINRATLYRRLNGGGDSLSIKEADAILKKLKLTEKEAASIFFSQFVA